MTIEYNVSEQDFVNFNLFHAKHSKQAKNAKLLSVYGGAALCFFMLVFVLVVMRGYDTVSVCVYGAIIAILWVIFFPKYYEFRVKKILAKHISEGKNNDFLGHQKLTLQEDCMEKISDSSTIHIKYTAIEKIAHDYDCVFVYVGAIQAFIIPFSAFPDAEQKSRFIEEIRKKSGL